MATKKSASKKTAGTGTSAVTPAVKTAAKKSAEKTVTAPAAAATPALKKAPAKVAEVLVSSHAEASHTEGHGAEKKAAGKGHPSRHEIEVRAYLLSEKDHHHHHQDYYWRKAEHELLSE